MENHKSQMIKRNDKPATSMQSRPQGSQTTSGRININDINKRNAEQEKQEMKASYIMIGIVIFVIVLSTNNVYVKD